MKGNGRSYTPPERPLNPVKGAEAIRKAAMKIFARNDGEAADWPLIAESLFKVAFDCLDRTGDERRRMSMLRRLEAGTYDRLAKNEPEPWQDGAAALPPPPLPEPGPRLGLDEPGLDMGPRRPRRTRH